MALAKCSSSNEAGFSLVETLIAASIVYMALENIVGANVVRRWLITFAFGLVHGFGFSFALRDSLQFAGSHLLTALLSFNLGVELGQLLVLAAVVPALNVMFRFVVAERMGTIILSAIVAHTAWHWLTERGGQLLQFPWPALDATLLLTVVRMAIGIVALAAVIWIVRLQVRRKAGVATGESGGFAPADQPPPRLRWSAEARRLITRAKAETGRYAQEEGRP